MPEWYQTAPDTITTRLDYLNVTVGTAAASKAVVLDSSRAVDYLDVTTFKVGGVDKSAVAIGAAAGYKIARGETALDGSNPTPVTHGLTTCVAFTATLKSTTAPTVRTLTANINGAAVDVYAWKATSTADTTLIASTGVESVYWTAIGT